ncbi:MAG: hypothetical protein GY801_30455 [bacterium]|nr:hypothetical protein [bacterium]
MASVQRLMLYITPVWILNIMCHVYPKIVIGLLCHWMNEKNPNIEERSLAGRIINPVQVAKKMSKLSNLSILHLLRQDESLWRMYLPGIGRESDNSISRGKVIPFKMLPYMLLELMFDLGGEEGRKKVAQIVARSRVMLGGMKQGEMFEYFKTETVLDLFEMMPPIEVRMRLLFSDSKAVAFWLEHWDLRMRRTDQPMKSAYWISQLHGKKAYEIENLMKDLEFRRKFEDIGDIYDKRSEWRR